MFHSYDKTHYYNVYIIELRWFKKASKRQDATDSDSGLWIVLNVSSIPSSEAIESSLIPQQKQISWANNWTL